MVYGKIYMILHNKTGRMYIGRSKNTKERIKRHFALLRAGRHSVEDMQEDFDKFGDDFTISIISESNAENRNAEIEMMEKHNSCIRGIGYNYKDPHAVIAYVKRREREQWQTLNG